MSTLIQITKPTELIVNNTPIIGGVAGRVLFQGTGNVLQQSSSLFWDSTNNRLGIGTSTPSKYLELKLPTGVNTLNDGIVITRGAGSGIFALANATSNVNDFIPSIYSKSSIDNAGFYFGASVFSTTSTFPAMEFQSANATNTGAINSGQIVARFANWTSNLLEIRGNGNVLINTTTDAGFKLDVNGTARVQGNTTVALNQNALTQINISNTTSGSSASPILNLTSDVASGIFQFGKQSTLTNVYKIIAAKDGFIYNSTTGGDIAILNDFASGRIKFATGGVSTAQMTLFSTGNLLINTTTDAGFRLDVNGTARVQTSAYFATTSGSVGIGTSSPAQKLVVSNAAGGATTTFTNTTDADLQILLTSGVSLISPTTNTLAFGTTTTERMRLTSSGTLLVGATSNNTSSDISTTAQLIATRGTIKYPLTLSTAGTPISGDQIRMSFNYGSGFSATAYMGSLVENASTAATSLIFGTFASSLAEKMRLTSAGNLLLNTTTDVASSKLTIESTTQGFLPPRGSNAQMLAIASPATGLIFFDNTNNKLNCYDGTTWQPCW
jgi:hypothetical protein